MAKQIKIGFDKVPSPVTKQYPQLKDIFGADLIDAAGNPLPPPEGHDDWRNTGYKQLYLHGQRAMYIFTADGADSENMANLTSSAWPVIRKDEYMEHIQ